MLRDLVYGQANINDATQKKLTSNDKSLETIQAKLDGFSTAVKNQLSFNKALETQLAQLATALPTVVKSVNVVTTRGGKTTRDPPYPSTNNKNMADNTTEKTPEEDHPKKVHDWKTAPHDSIIPKYCRFP